MELVAAIGKALVVAFLVFLLLLIARVTIVRALLVRFWYEVESFLGREPGDDVSVTYEERRHRLDFYGNRDDWIVRIPDAGAWAHVMPPWAGTRRDEIVGRLRRRAARRLILQDAPADGGCRVVWREKLAGGERKVQQLC